MTDGFTPRRDLDFIRRNAGRVAVIMGGISAERDISLLSGKAICDALVRQGISAIEVDWQSDILPLLQSLSFDRAFIALHGRGGEDGTMQGVLELMNKPYTGSKVMASAVSMDKIRTKLLWRSLNVPTPEFDVITPGDDLRRVEASIGFPMMIKPAHEGSSIGVSKVKTEAELPSAVQTAASYDESIFAEQFIAGSEYFIPIIDGQNLPIIGCETPREFYDYEAKYCTDTTRYICPSGLDPKLEDEIIELGILAFEAVGATGWGRVDLMLDGDGAPWFTEMNTIPGMTNHSLVPFSALVAGIEFDELVLHILGTSFV